MLLDFLDFLIRIPSKFWNILGAGSIFFGHGTEEEIDTLERQLANPAQVRTLSIFCEYPINPLSTIQIHL
jgi:hypothetical protein